MKILAHCLVKNEENFIWYAINSVIDYLDRVIVWDTGSTDDTLPIIKSIKSPKIEFEKKGFAAPERITQLRGQMIEETQADWIFILDGDEIWWDESIRNLKLEIRNLKYDLVVNPNYMLVGDIYHYQEEIAGKYKIADKVGHYNIRAIRNVSGLHIEGVYPNEAYVDGRGVKIQDFPEERIYFSEFPYLHASFLTRSSKDSKKKKYEIGNEFPKDFYYPEVIFRPCPAIVPSPWSPMDYDYKLRAFFSTPLKKIKRRLLV